MRFKRADITRIDVELYGLAFVPKDSHIDLMDLRDVEGLEMHEIPHYDVYEIRFKEIMDITCMDMEYSEEMEENVRMEIRNSFKSIEKKYTGDCQLIVLSIVDWEFY